MAGRSMPGHRPRRAGHRPMDRAWIGSTSESPTRRRRTVAPVARRTLWEKIFLNKEKNKSEPLFPLINGIGG
jgi:hypothetical protein